MTNDFPIRQLGLFEASGSLDVVPAGTPLLRPLPPPTLPEAKARRDELLDRYEAERRTTVRALQDEAWKQYERMRRPISVLDIRHVLERVGYTGDPRILASAFPRREWTPVAFIPNPNAHARLVRTFLPKTEVR